MMYLVRFLGHCKTRRRELTFPTLHNDVDRRDEGINNINLYNKTYKSVLQQLGPLRSNFFAGDWKAVCVLTIPIATVNCCALSVCGHFLTSIQLWALDTGLETL